MDLFQDGFKWIIPSDIEVPLREFVQTSKMNVGQSTFAQTFAAF